MGHKPSAKGKPLSARVKIRVTLYDNLGGAFQQLANLYGLSYDQLAERMLLSGVESHLTAIQEMQTKGEQKQNAQPEPEANESNTTVPVSGP